MSEPKLELISLREYSRRIGVSDVAVKKAVKAGKIVHGYVQITPGKYKINPAVANLEWGRNYNPNYVRNENVREKIGGIKEAPPPKEEPSDDQEELASGKLNPGSLASIKLHQARVRLQREAIELRELQGKLVDKQKVYNALFAAGQEVRAAIMAVPDRTIDAVLSATNRNEAHGILHRALVEALESVTNTQQREIGG